MTGNFKFNTKFLLYTVSTTFSANLECEICEQTSVFLNKYSKKYAKLDASDKIYYSKYAIQLVQKLTEYLEQINRFRMKEEDDDAAYDFCLITGNNKKNYVSLQYSTLNLNNVVPNKLTKICHCDKDSIVTKSYDKSYNVINKDVYSEFSCYDKYIDIKPKIMESTLKKNQFVI